MPQGPQLTECFPLSHTCFYRGRLRQARVRALVTLSHPPHPPHTHKGLCVLDLEGRRDLGWGSSCDHPVQGTCEGGPVALKS